VNKLRVKLVCGDQALLDEIRVLWEALNSHHLGLSPNFKQHYQDMTFQKRKADLLKKATTGKIRIDLAIDESTGQKVGYCVVSVDAEKKGEIESFFVDAAFRGMGVGDLLMKKAL
jgi:ribosomal protein S18 acetylase RimI-like enzyme